MRVPSARIREKKDRGIGEMNPRAAYGTVRFIGKEYAKDGDPKKDHDPGPVLSDHPFETALASSIFIRTQGVNSAAGTADDVGDSKVPFRQPPIVLIGQGFGDQARCIEELPEAVGVSCEMMPHLGGAESWIDTHEEDMEPGFYMVREYERGLSSRCHLFEAV